jgi:hypothetical protein
MRTDCFALAVTLARETWWGTHDTKEDRAYERETEGHTPNTETSGYAVKQESKERRTLQQRDSRASTM